MKASPYAWLALLLAICFTLATRLELHALRSSTREGSGSFIEKALGDGRRIFANQFFTMADVYLHSGFYPSIFDRQEKPKATALKGGNDEHDHDEHDSDTAHEEEFSFMGEPKDWIERFGRHFKVTEHTHLENGQQREVLPWLELAAEMDPQMIQTYTAAAFMLRKELKRPKEAEAFLREGLLNNPGNYEILFELGLIYYDDYHDTDRARNVWLAALRRWDRQNTDAKVASVDGYRKITANLGHLEDVAGNGQRAIQYLEMAKQVSPNPDALQKQIDEIQAKFTTPSPP